MKFLFNVTTIEAGLLLHQRYLIFLDLLPMKLIRISQLGTKNNMYKTLRIQINRVTTGDVGVCYSNSEIEVLCKQSF